MVEIIEKVMNLTTSLLTLITAAVSLKVITSSKKHNDDD